MGSEEKRSQGQSTVGGGGGMSEQPKTGGRVSGGGELGLSSGNMLSLRNPLGITVGDVK